MPLGIETEDLTSVQRHLRPFTALWLCLTLTLEIIRAIHQPLNPDPNPNPSLSPSLWSLPGSVLLESVSGRGGCNVLPTAAMLLLSLPLRPREHKWVLGLAWGMCAVLRSLHVGWGWMPLLAWMHWPVALLSFHLRSSSLRQVVLPTLFLLLVLDLSPDGRAWLGDGLPHSWASACLTWALKACVAWAVHLLQRPSV